MNAKMLHTVSFILLIVAVTVLDLRHWFEIPLDVPVAIGFLALACTNMAAAITAKRKQN